MWNLIIGIILIILGLSGRFAFIGTGSPQLLVVIGIAIAGWGAFQVYRADQLEHHQKQADFPAVDRQPSPIPPNQETQDYPQGQVGQQG